LFKIHQMTFKYSILICFLLCSIEKSLAQSIASIKEYKKSYVTYPFSDPDPIPSQTAIYPYFRFDGFTNTPINKEWTVVELENDYIKVAILPEIGGKIWTAIDKTSGKPYLYDNKVIKFRDIAMRGPWTSGGLEPNYGIIGHTPNCATPVDYLTRKNENGSVSCFIGVLDLLTRTRWQIEINLPKDKAYFTTNSIWTNPTGLGQPYYHWMNAGIKTKGNLEFIYPGTSYIGHDGEHASWPVNQTNGKNINFYEENNFGTYKSYHVLGKHTDFFGTYWHDDQFGMVRYAPYDEKIGKKNMDLGIVKTRHDLGKNVDRHRWSICRDPVWPPLQPKCGRQQLNTIQTSWLCSSWNRQMDGILVSGQSYQRHGCCQCLCCPQYQMGKWVVEMVLLTRGFFHR